MKRIADLLDRPRAALAARFGTELICAASTRLSGVDDESITPRLPLPRYVAEQRFADPIALEARRARHHRAARRASTRTLEQHGEGARLLEIALFRVDGKVLRHLGRHQPGDPRASRADPPPVRRAA